MLRYPDDTRCPNCRGPGLAKSLFHYVGAASPNEVIEAARRATQLLQQQEEASSFTDARSETPTRSDAPPTATSTFFLTDAECTMWYYSGTHLPAEEWRIDESIKRHRDALDPVYVSDFEEWKRLLPSQPFKEWPTA